MEDQQVGALAKTVCAHERADVRFVSGADDCHAWLYLSEPFEQVIGDQLAFLRRHVPVAS